jgi:hypothetical protein
MLQGLLRQGVGQARQVGFDRGPAQLQHQASVHHILTGGAQMHIALGSGTPAAITLPNAFTSGIAELPAVAMASANARTS